MPLQVAERLFAIMRGRIAQIKDPRRGRIWKAITLLILVVALLYLLTYDPSTVGYWRSAEGQRAYEQAYAEAMAALPAPTGTYDIPTTYGTVRVYAWTPDQHQSRTPAVFLPGRSSGVPMWYANLPAVAATRPVYAMDALGDAGLSQQTVALEDGADQAAWLDEVLGALELESVHLVGHSFGGWAAANYASRYPERVATLVLLEPVLTFQGLHLEVYIKSIPASLPFLPRAWREAFLQDVGGGGEGDLDDPVARMIANGVEHYAAKLPVPEQLAQEQLQAWSMPVFVAMAGESALHDGAEATRVAEAQVPEVQATLWPTATHSLPMEVASELNDDIISFMNEHD